MLYITERDGERQNPRELILYQDNVALGTFCYPFPKRQILHPFKMEEFADDSFKFVDTGRKLSKQVENTVGKGEIARYEQFLLFPQCFQKTCTTDPKKKKKRACLGKG